MPATKRTRSNPYIAEPSFHPEDVWDEGYEAGHADAMAEAKVGLNEDLRRAVLEALAAARRALPDGPERWDVDDALRLIEAEDERERRQQ